MTDANTYVVNFKADGVVRSEYFEGYTEYDAYLECVAKYRHTKVLLISIKIEIDRGATDER